MDAVPPPCTYLHNPAVIPLYTHVLLWWVSMFFKGLNVVKYIITVLQKVNTSNPLARSHLAMPTQIQVQPPHAHPDYSWSPCDQWLCKWKKFICICCWLVTRDVTVDLDSTQGCPEKYISSDFIVTSVRLEIDFRYPLQYSCHNQIRFNMCGCGYIYYLLVSSIKEDWRKTHIVNAYSIHLFRRENY